MKWFLIPAILKKAEAVKRSIKEKLRPAILD
jgi:hypothetical protein